MKRFLSLLCVICLFVPCFSGCGEKRTTINVYNVGDYIDEDVIDLFEKENPTRFAWG